MKLDRNINKDGKGKYALIQLRKVERGSADWAILCDLASRGILEWGCVGAPDEFFVVKLRDKYAPAAIGAYSDAVARDSSTHADDEKKANDLMQWAIQVQSLQERAGGLSRFCKEPD